MWPDWMSVIEHCYIKECCGLCLLPADRPISQLPLSLHKKPEANNLPSCIDTDICGQYILLAMMDVLMQILRHFDDLEVEDCSVFDEETIPKKQDLDCNMIDMEKSIESNDR